MGTLSDVIEVTVDQLEKGIELKTGKRYILKLVDYKLHVRLDINPNDKTSTDDRFTLFGGHHIDDRQYEMVKSTKDDVIDGDDYVDLVFTDLIPKLRYWLKVDPGKEGEPYYAIEDVDWSDLVQIVR